MAERCEITVHSRAGTKVLLRGNLLTLDGARLGAREV